MGAEGQVVCLEWLEGPGNWETSFEDYTGYPELEFGFAKSWGERN